MNTYTMINLVTEQLITVQANSRLHARSKACSMAGHPDAERCYWIAKQDYHNVTGYKVLST